MPIALIDNVSVDSITSVVESSFDDAKRSFEMPQRTIWQEIATQIDGRGVEEVLHDWFENLAPMRAWTGGKHFADMVERQYKTTHRFYEASVRMKRDQLMHRIRSQGFGAAAMGITNKLAARAAVNDEIQTLAALVANTLLGYDGKALLATDHPDGGGQSNLDAGGGGQRWYLCSLGHEVGPLLRILGDDYLIRDHAGEETAENFFNRMLYWSVEFKGGYYPGLWQTIYGSNQTLNATNFDAAMQAMAALKDYHGDELGIVPTHIVVGRSNWRPARALLAPATITTGGENVDKGAVEILYSPRLP